MSNEFYPDYQFLFSPSNISLTFSNYTLVKNYQGEYSSDDFIKEARREEGTKEKEKDLTSF